LNFIVALGLTSLLDELYDLLDLVLGESWERLLFVVLQLLDKFDLLV
jgi:hypothetical protein